MQPIVPVDHLPPEILNIVFSILSTIDRPRWKRIAHSNIRYKRHLGWLKVTHVCQRWRNIALRDPVLWASDIALPSSLGHRWAAAFVSRAQDVPLTVTWCNDLSPNNGSPSSDTLFIGANLARTGAIMHLCIHSQHLPTLCTPAPLLRTISLCIYSTKGQTFYLPDGLFGGAAGLPELRHLSVTAWEPLSWTPLLLQHLVSVNITIFVQLPGAVLASMFAALGRMPALQRLALELTPEATEGVPVTLLPALRHLTLRCTSVQYILPILACLALPAGIRVRCHANGLANMLADLFPAMTTFTHATAISRVDVKPGAASRRCPGADVEVRAWRSGDTDGAPALAVRFWSYQWKRVPGVLRSIASTHLEVLSVGGDAPDAAWLDALGGAPRLHRVTVKGGAVPPFCAALERAPDVLPALATLVINIQAHPLAETVLRDTLPRCLAARASAGNLLRELQVVGCDEDEACTRVLQNAVPGLVIRWWGEAEAEAEDEDEEANEDEDEDEEDEEEEEDEEDEEDHEDEEDEEEDTTISDSDASELED
ncbi:hypothetical protein FA95DRAFT_1413146 [Auriscalpium vulgare]|uniref:Uncharacterized protein n=1 Tax=Auriscalpium vulgare TaxID=40419 RepID=A0ACB8RPI8_9AGAM|nr:hypothetical protein FA95DRAFT_1413146 [Auriscalpium vulgare]